MIWTELTRMAARIACEAHKNDVDKAGLPYVLHLATVAEAQTDEAATCVAWLHDLVEDHGDEWTIGGLSLYGFPHDVLHAVALLTHRDGENYADYIWNIAEDPIAKRVKIADLRHNMDTTRLGGVKPPKYDLYVKALAFLTKD